MLAELASRFEEGVERDVLVWRFPEGLLCASSASVGGGVGKRYWALNAEVSLEYSRSDVETHVAELAEAFSLPGHGVGMLTAARVRRRESAREAGVVVESTVGLSHPIWAARAEREVRESVGPGTINITAFFPVRLSEGALLNAIMSATEAKTQALWAAGISGTGTASDAVSIFCPLSGEEERFCGPRSLWGSRLARVVYQSVLVGAKLGPS